MASTEATSEESSAEELVASETEAKVISEDAEAADQSKHGATGGGTGVTDRVTDVYLGSNGFNIQYNQPIADGAKIMFAVWSDKNGQDDLIWYKTTKDSNTTYSAIISVAEHNLESGRYNVHVYGTSAVTNALTGLAGTHFEADYHFGDVAVDATLAKDGIDLTMPSDVSKGMAVYHAVWSTENDQDDIVWYKADPSGHTKANYTGSYGTYLVHTYGVVHG